MKLIISSHTHSKLYRDVILSRQECKSFLVTHVDGYQILINYDGSTTVWPATTLDLRYL